MGGRSPLRWEAWHGRTRCCCSCGRRGCGANGEPSGYWFGDRPIGNQFVCSLRFAGVGRCAVTDARNDDVNTSAMFARRRRIHVGRCPLACLGPPSSREGQGTASMHCHGWANGANCSAWAAWENVILHAARLEQRTHDTVMHPANSSAPWGGIVCQRTLAALTKILRCQ